jgi:hypothetical protein
VRRIKASQANASQFADLIRPHLSFVFSPRPLAFSLLPPLFLLLSVPLIKLCADGALKSVCANSLLFLVKLHTRATDLKTSGLVSLSLNSLSPSLVEGGGSKIITLNFTRATPP